jgi:hypothetical protein
MCSTFRVPYSTTGNKWNKSCPAHYETVCYGKREELVFNVDFILISSSIDIGLSLRFCRFLFICNDFLVFYYIFIFGSIQTLGVFLLFDRFPVTFNHVYKPKFLAVIVYYTVQCLASADKPRCILFPIFLRFSFLRVHTTLSVLLLNFSTSFQHILTIFV